MHTALAWALAIPFAAAVLIQMSHPRPNQREGVTLVAAAALAWTVFGLVPEVMAGARPSFTLLTILPGLDLRLEVEPLGLVFGIIASALWIVNSIYSIGYMRGNRESHQTRFYTCFALALGSTVGIAFAANLFTLFVFYEALTLCTYPLVAHKGDAKARDGARTYLSILLGTSLAFLLVAVVWTWVAAGTLDFQPGGILAGKVGGWELGVLFALYMFGVGKAALMPVHRWLPAAMVAPTPVSALLHAVAVVKAGVFTVVKVIVYVFGTELLLAEPSTSWLLYLAGFTIIAASVIALRQDNLKRRLAYSTVSQLSYVIMAAAILAPWSVAGAAVHIAAHAFGKITLFFAAGAIYTAAHKTEVSQLTGIGRRMPWTMGAFAVGALSMVGVPPTFGFISKWYILQGAVQAEALVAVLVIVASTALNAAYFFPVIYRAFFMQEPTPQAAGSASGGGHGQGGHEEGGHGEGGHGEAPWPVVVATTATALGTVALFFWPDLAIGLATQLVTK